MSTVRIDGTTLHVELKASEALRAETRIAATSTGGALRPSRYWNVEAVTRCTVKVA